MKKIFLLFLLCTLHFAFIRAQDSIVFKNGKTIVGKVVSIGKEKVVYMVPPDSLKKVASNWRLQYIRYAGGTEYNFASFKKPEVKGSPTSLYFSADAGFSVPSISYKDAIVGEHFALRGTFYFNDHVGITLRVAQDYNGTGLNYISNNYWGGFYIFNQYLGGLTYRTGGKPGYPWLDFVGLIGICDVATPVSETGNGLYGITVTTPGTGKGYGAYFGMDFTSSEDHPISITFGLGCFGGVFGYANYSSAFTKYDAITNTTTNTVSKSNTTMGVALPQMYLGINFRAKRAQH